MHDSLITSLYQIGAIQFGDFKLKSGQTSSIYINLRKIISYSNILRAIADEMWLATRSYPYDLICGVPYTALPIATCMSLEHDLPMVMRRKEKKDYGTMQTIEGEYKPGQTCLIIEDVITTGGSVIETANELEGANLQVHDVVALIDREQGGRENLEKKYRVHTIFTLSDILHSLLNSNLLSNQERHIIEQYVHARTS